MNEKEKVSKKTTHNPAEDRLRYVEKKMTDKGIQRMERHPVDGLPLAHGPPKSGRGGKFTWEGPAADPMENELDPLPPAVDPHDPNYVDEDEEEEETGAVVIGEVEVAKVAEAREGVSRIEVQPPLTSTILTTTQDQD